MIIIKFTGMNHNRCYKQDFSDNDVSMFQLMLGRDIFGMNHGA